MSGVPIHRMLATSSLMSAATAFRMGASWLELSLDRAPSLMKLGMEASAGGGDPDRARAAFRDELLALTRESVEASWRELRRGADDLEVFTRPPEGYTGGAPRRPHRPKQ